ncbi:MAG TPA: ABC transporter permease [Candidatus Acidoferrales bacterium]|nr:ABC transporter permease [Candidatus Acidoferrales bacterium]
MNEEALTVETLLQDVRYALRMLRKSPAFTAVAILTLALGIGANTAIFSVFDPLILRPLPIRDLDRLVKVSETRPAQGVEHNEVAVANYLDWRAQSNVFESLGAFAWWTVNLAGIENPERLQGFKVTPEFFPAMGMTPLMGRAFLPEEGVAGNDHEIILSYGCWQRRFGGDPQIIGKSLLLSDVSRTVVGVMPREFNYPPGGEMWAPLPMNPNSPGARQSHYLYVVGRLRPGVTVEAAQAQLGTIGQRLEKEYPKTNAGWGVGVVPLLNDVVRDYRPALVLLLASVGFLLLIACANVANLTLAKAAARRRELTLRATLGAGRGRLARQLLTESVLLGMCGGALGVGFALVGVALLPGLFPSSFLQSIPGAEKIGVNLPALGFTFLLSLGTGMVFGIAPALRASNPDLHGSLKQAAVQSGGSARQNRVRGGLVTGEISLAVVLLAGAGLMVRSFVGLLDVNPGFQTGHILTMEVSLSRARYPDEQKAAAFFAQLVERVRALPGVESAGAANIMPLEGENGTTGILIEGRPAPLPGQFHEVNYRSVTPGYLTTLGISMLRGRGITEQDTAGSPRVILLNQAAVERYFAGQDPVGMHVRFDEEGGTQPWMTVAGIVPDIRNELNRRAAPEVYVALAQNVEYSMYVSVRTAGDPAGIGAAVRAQVKSLDKDQPIAHLRTFEEARAQSVFNQRIPTLLLGIFAVLALTIASVGVYGLISFLVSQRSHEFGVRAALGAQKSDVFRLVIGEGARMVLLGLAIGLAAALALTRAMEGLLYGVSARDPWTYATIAALLAATGLLACYIPARRATRVDPLVALRYE